MIIRLYKKSINHSADRYSIEILVAYTLGGLFALAVLPFMTLHLYHDAYSREEVFGSLKPEKVVKQWVVQENEYGKTNVELVTRSGVHLRLGIHTPNYRELKRAVEEQRSLRAWWHIFEFRPHFLAELAQVNRPRVFQVSDDSRSIVPFAEMTKHRQEGYYIIIIFAVMILCLVVFLPTIIGAVFVKLKKGKEAGAGGE